MVTGLSESPSFQTVVLSLQAAEAQRERVELHSSTTLQVKKLHQGAAEHRTWEVPESLLKPCKRMFGFQRGLCSF